MHLAHLHSVRGDPPLGSIQVDLNPFGSSQLTGSNKYQRSKLQSCFDRKVAAVAVKCSQQLGHLAGLCEGGSIGHPDGCQRTTKIAGRITNSATGCNGVTGHLAHTLFYPVGRFMLSAPLKPTRRPSRT